MAAEGAGRETGLENVLLANLTAVRDVAEAVEGTFGPNGLDCLLYDDDGEIIVTNDGVTILRHLRTVHPVGRLIVQAAMAQERAVGDGTTTATIIAAALVGEATNQILRGVPTAKVLVGIKAGIERALEVLAGLRIPVAGLDDPALAAVALVAGRGDDHLARMVLEAAAMLGADRLAAEGFSLAESVIGLEDTAEEIYAGVIVERCPVAPEMPAQLSDTAVLLLEGALEPEPLPPEAMATAAGLARADAGRVALRIQLERLAAAGTGLVLTGQGICDPAVQFLADRGVIAARRVPWRELRRAAALTGARIIQNLPDKDGDLDAVLGRADKVEVDPIARLIKIANCSRPREVSILVGGGATGVVAERERIARDTAAALLQAWRGGVVPGGGAVELALARSMDGLAAELDGLTARGVQCVKEALKRPLAQLAANAGYNPMEKVEEALAAQARTNRSSLGIDPDTGAVADQTALGIWDPYPVKECALRTAGEIAAAVLRINNILPKRIGSSASEEWRDPVADR